MATLPHDRRLIIFAAGKCEELFQLPLQGLESGPLILVFLPALEHDVVQGLRRALWTRHSVTMLHLMQHLSI